MESNQTSGVDTSGFIPTETHKNEFTREVDSSEGLGGKVNYALGILPTVVKTLEEHFSFVASLVSLVGYIVISAFGHIDTIEKYFGYTLFLLFIYFLYNLSCKKIKIELNFSKASWVLISVVIFLLLIIVIQNISMFQQLFVQFLKLFNHTKK